MVRSFSHAISSACARGAVTPVWPSMRHTTRTGAQRSESSTNGALKGVPDSRASSSERKGRLELTLTSTSLTSGSATSGNRSPAPLELKRVLSRGQPKSNGARSIGRAKCLSVSADPSSRRHSSSSTRPCLSTSQRTSGASTNTAASFATAAPSDWACASSMKSASPNRSRKKVPLTVGRAGCASSPSSTSRGVWCVVSAGGEREKLHVSVAVCGVGRG
eukprot:scaffold72987_cov25-Tisochrysis_lutea.AAC.2